jgi:hypothetical protein
MYVCMSPAAVAKPCDRGIMYACMHVCMHVCMYCGVYLEAQTLISLTTYQ